MRRRGLAIALVAAVLMAVPAAAQTRQIADLQEKGDAPAKRTADARVPADAAAAQFCEAQRKLDELNEQLSVLEAQVAQKQQELEALRADLREFAIDQYMAGGAAESPSIFDSDNLNDAVTKDALADVVGGRKL